MIVKKKNKMYTSKSAMVHGNGYMDTLRGIGSYIAQNKDLIAKPMLGAVGELGAFGLMEGGKALIRKLAEEKPIKQLNSESQQILDRLYNGSGIKKF